MWKFTKMIEVDSTLRMGIKYRTYNFRKLSTGILMFTANDYTGNFRESPALMIYPFQYWDLAKLAKHTPACTHIMERKTGL